MPSREFEAFGRRWRCYRIEYPAQVEVECILARLLGPAAGHAIGALASGLAPTIVEVLRETVGDGDGFDLSRILELDTADPRIRSAWDLLLDGLGRTLGDVLAAAASSLASGMDPAANLRLLELTLLDRRLEVHHGGQWMVIGSLDALGQLLDHDPRAKWQLCGESIATTWIPAPAPAPDDAEAEDA
jgi:hypothetical protein